MKKTIIDPPQGWLYGFPKELPDPPPDNMVAWLVENGYPERDVEWAVNHCGMWEADCEEDATKKN